MSAVLHLIVTTLKKDADPQELSRALKLANSMSNGPGVLTVAIGRSPDHVLVATWLSDREDLEPFAASSVHMEFVMQGAAPVTDSMWSAAVETNVPVVSAIADTEALWGFALPTRDGVYEWQVKQLLSQVANMPGLAATGTTVEDWDRFRAAGVVLIGSKQVSEFETALATAKNRWLEIAGEMEDILVPIWH